MFVTKKTFERETHDLLMQIKVLDEKYWNLLLKHERLMRHLGLCEKTRSGVEICSKGESKTKDQP